MSERFATDIDQMATVIESEDYTLTQTDDMGILQAQRLQRFLLSDQGVGTDIPEFDTLTYKEIYKGFPTIGAEFHLPSNFEATDSFWQRVALLNMSQYLRGSYVPLSRIDQGLIEIRMNPSTFPVATATWNLMRRILPEINSECFTMTVMGDDTSFSKNEMDLVDLLRTVSAFNYAAYFQTVPDSFAEGEMSFGDFYIGQSVLFRNGKFELIGDINKGIGQLVIYTGYRDSFSHLGYYLSMGIVDKKVLAPLRTSGFKGKITPQKALSTQVEDIQNLFDGVDGNIDQNYRLKRARDNHNSVVAALSA